MKRIATLLSMALATPAMAHEAALPHAHTSETTWVPVTLLVAVFTVALVLLRKTSKKS